MIIQFFISPKIPCTSVWKNSPLQCQIHDFFWQVGTFFSLENFENVSFWISRKCLSGVFLVHFLQFISTFLLVVKLVAFVFSYNMSNIDLVLKGQKIFFRSFLVRLGENLLEFYLLLIALLFFDGKNKQIKF